MSMSLEAAKELYCIRNKVHSADRRKNITLTFVRFNNKNEAIFRVRECPSPSGVFWTAVKVDLQHLNEVCAINKSIAQFQMSKQYIADLIKTQVKRFTASDIKQIHVEDDYVHVYISNQSYAYKGNFKIRRV